MNRKIRSSLYTGVIALLASASSAVAQSNDARAAISAERGVTFYRPDDFALATQPSDHDIVLMESHQPWYLTAHGEMEASDNAFLTAPKHSDVWVVGALDAGFQTTINESFDLQVGGQVAASRFHKYSELDTDSLAGIISISKQETENFRVGVDYIPAVYFGRGFDEQSLLSHDLGVFGRYTWQWDETSLLIAYARLSRQWTTPHDYTNTRLAVTLACQHECLPKLISTTGVTFAYELYDDYFESITHERRRDLMVNPFVSVVYQLSDNATLGMTLSYARNYSGIDQVDYEAAGIIPYVEFNWRF